MLGYVTTEKAELKMREYEVYSAYYCGVCKSIGRRFGQLPRLTLSYDAAFLALLLASIDDAQDSISPAHCLIHPVKKKNIAFDNAAIDYAADIMLILAYHKLEDDYADEKKLRAKGGILLMKPHYNKLCRMHRETCETVGQLLKELSSLESAFCPGLDQAAEPFAKLMEALFVCESLIESQTNRLLLARMGYHMGKWIYVCDALDDIAENAENGAYNPLFYRFSYDKKTESPAEFKRRIAPVVEFNLLQYLAELGKAFDLLPVKKNKGILENIIYMGLLRKTEQLLDKNSDQPAQQSKA